jgi:hypothetical protein
MYHFEPGYAKLRTEEIEMADLKAVSEERQFEPLPAEPSSKFYTHLGRALALLGVVLSSAVAITITVYLKQVNGFFLVHSFRLI